LEGKQWKSEKDRSRSLKNQKKDISNLGRPLKDIFKKMDAAPPLHIGSEKCKKKRGGAAEATAIYISVESITLFLQGNRETLSFCYGIGPCSDGQL
jgi:hypothetical protein